MIIFAQDPTSHSRLANSLVWMSKIQSFLISHQIEYCFPWAVENFGNYLDSSSKWMAKNTGYELFYKYTGQLLNAQNLSSICRKFEHNYEVENNLKAFEWSKIVKYIDDNNILYLTGAIKLESDLLINNFKDSLVILKEPFNFIFPEKNIEISDFLHLIPNQDLYENQKFFIEKTSASKRNIGFHIRRGDYKTWANGEYYYPDEFWLKKVEEQLRFGNFVWVFSNDINDNLVNQLINLGAFVSQTSFEIDFVRMMFMNELYGPPSTFSGMASKISSLIFNNNNNYFQLPPISKL